MFNINEVQAITTKAADKTKLCIILLGESDFRALKKITVTVATIATTEATAGIKYIAMKKILLGNDILSALP